jgi:hypothetical protein
LRLLQGDRADRAAERQAELRELRGAKKKKGKGA